MSDSRARILARLKKPGPYEPPAPPTQPPARDWDLDERIRRFTERMTAVRAEVLRVGAEDWPDKLRGLCREKGISALLHGTDGPLGEALATTFATAGETRLVPYAEPVEHWKEQLFFDTDAAITSCRAGIAETGTLILWPTPEEPRLMSLVPPVHFAVLRTAGLYSTFADAVREQQWTAGLPTNALLISGPSKSADIEQTLAYGVHGPKELIVLLVA